MHGVHSALKADLKGLCSSCKISPSH